MYMCIYIYIYMHTHTHCRSDCAARAPRLQVPARRRRGEDLEASGSFMGIYKGSIRV